VKLSIIPELIVTNSVLKRSATIMWIPPRTTVPTNEKINVTMLKTNFPEVAWKRRKTFTQAEDLLIMFEADIWGEPMVKRKSWSEKLEDSKGLPKVEKITDKMSKRWGTGTVVIPAPMEVDEVMRRVPEGKLITINEIRALLARKHGATIGCPITTGIFAWVAANASEERKLQGGEGVAPYWRTLKTGGEINEKYPGGVEGQKRLLEKEGHTVVQKGKKYVVVDYEKSLAKM
jgi:alkylated DNA nucleotide flippase Atl1